MSWGRLDDSLGRNDKFRKLRRSNDGHMAIGTWTWWLSYCLGDPKLNGFIPESELNARDLKVAHLLVDVGLWKPADGGYQVHDFELYALSPKQLEKKRKDDARRQREKRERDRVTRDIMRDSQRDSGRDTSRDGWCDPGSPVSRIPLETVSVVSDQVQELNAVHSPPPAATGGEKKPRKLTPAQQIWEIYASAYYVDCGSRPTERREWFVHIATWLKQGITADEIAKRLRNYFESPPFVCREGARDFGRFVRFFDQLALPATETNGERVQRVLDGDRRAKELPAVFAPPQALGVSDARP